MDTVSKFILVAFLTLLLSCDRKIEHPLTVYVFLSTECPLCKEQIGNLNTLSNSFKQVAFIGIFPNSTDTEESIIEFRNRYQLVFQTTTDYDHRLADSFRATVTPEAVLVDRNGEVLYKGLLDNRMEALGKKRRVITKRYLHDAIERALDGDYVEQKHTSAVGCSIYTSP